MEQIITDGNGKIISHIDAPNLIQGAIAAPGFAGIVGTYIDEYDDDWRFLPLADRVNLGRVVVPDGKILSGDGIGWRDMTADERIIAGIDPVPSGYIISNGDIAPTLNKMIEIKISEISTAYIAERTTTNKGITSTVLGGAVIDCRESDVLNIQNLVTLLEAQGATEYFYKIKDNSDVPCTIEQMKTVLTELITALLSMWQLKQTLTEQINTATTAEEIQAIKWDWTNK